MGCKHNDPEPPGEKEVQLNKLVSTWQISSAIVDDEARADYDNFELTLSGSTNATVYTYAASGRPEMSPWLPGGTWSFGSSVSNQIIRDPGTNDELLMEYTIDDDILELVFDFSGEGYSTGRISGIKGHWVLTFNRQ